MSLRDSCSQRRKLSAKRGCRILKASRDEIDATETTAQLFRSASSSMRHCHNHPFEKWTPDDYYGTAAAFKRVGRKETGLPDDEMIFVSAGGDVTQPRTGKQMKVRLLLEEAS